MATRFRQLQKQTSVLVTASAGLLAASSAQALDLNWSGQFWSEAHYIRNYHFDPSEEGANTDTSRVNANGYYIPGGGNRDAHFQTLFMRVLPSATVNDNVYLHSEWWLGSPTFGLFGNAVPYDLEQRSFYSSQSRGSTISAQRFWAEFVTDVGTLQVGRAPLHWGLGLFWNEGQEMYSREPSTGDVVRLTAKFGLFKLTPAFIKYSQGNNLGGACNTVGGDCATVLGTGGAADYSLMFKLDNQDEGFEAGVNFVKRLAGGSQDPNGGFLTVRGATGDTAAVSTAYGLPAGGMNFNVIDLFARKQFGGLTLAGELPIINGNLRGLEYKSYALALEADWKISERWNTALRAGHAPGQGSFQEGALPGTYRAFYFHPDYRLGLIMFNYQLANFAGPNTANSPTVGESDLKSPFHNPIVNAQYLSWGGAWTPSKWAFRTNLIYARAHETAQAGQTFYNTRTRVFTANATKTQGSSLGFEWDFGTTFQWDDNVAFHFDTGIFFPGDYFAFSNVAGVDNRTSPAWANNLRVGVSF